MSQISTDKTISVVIAVLNEERTIGSILEVVRTWGKAREIIVVNDEATTDNTEKLIRRFGSSVVLLTNRKKHGRGDAVAVGIEAATSDVIILLDGDMTGLTHKDLDAMLRPIFLGSADLVIAVPRYWSMAGYAPFNEVSGSRVFYRRHVVPHLKAIHKAGYGMEVLINGLYQPSRIRMVRLPHVFVFNKFDKQTLPDAVQAYVREAKELVVAVVKQQAGDLPPQARQAFKSVQNYLKRALDYIQQ